MPYILEKGFIAIDGISLTIARVKGDIFSVSLIPETRARTSLGYKQVGAHVNMEPDMMTKCRWTQLCVSMPKKRSANDGLRVVR